MKKILLTSALMAIAATSIASDDKHFKGKTPTSYLQAQEQLIEGKAELAKMLEDGQVSMVEMGKVHQLTYSLENALEFMEDEMERIQDVLERVHEGSEHGASTQVFKDSQLFLKESEVLHTK